MARGILAPRAADIPPTSRYKQAIMPFDTTSHS